MTSDLSRVVSWAIEQPWAITPAMRGVVAQVLARRLAGQAPEAFDPRPAPSAAAPGSVAVLPLHGVLAPRMNLLSDISGGATFEEATSALQQLAADPNVATIVLDWDSPGGSVAGATEFAAALLQARDTKRIISVANHEMCSAAYWTGACASEVIATPSALVGSVGVYCIHEDLSAYLAKEGVALTYVAAGKFKVEGNSSAPLSETAHARLQAIVDAAYAAFVADVAAGRGVSPEAVRTGFGEGATLTATEALRDGLIDGIATLEATVARAATLPPLLRAPAAARSRAAADVAIGRELAGLGIF